MDVVIFIGVQASGKSTFYHKRFRETHVRINRDMLKTRHRVRRLFETCLEIEQRCVIDSMNLTRAAREPFLEAARAAGFSCIGYYFRTNVAESLARNRRRAEIYQVSDKAIMGSAARLERPALEEGFDHLHYVRQRPNRSFDVQVWNP